MGYDAQLRLAEQFLNNGQYARAYSVYDGVDASHVGSAEVQLALGASYLRSYAFLKAERAYAAAASLGAKDEGAIGLGRIALAKNDADGALVGFGDVLSRDQQNAIALNGVGVAYDLQGNHAEAQSYYRRALAADPTSSKSRNNLGLSLILSGDYDDAEGLLTDLAGSELDNAVARQNLALAFYLQGRESDAVELASLDVQEAEAMALFRAIRRYRRVSP
ncbi:MAG: tetratricopeptide repeat protein [Pseudomonadota bacterium]